MKKLLFISILLLGSITLTSITDEITPTTITSSDYQDGWKDGYCEGWKDVKGPYAVCPVTPVCPVPQVSCYEGFKCGYNRGFKKGRVDAKATKF